MAINFCDTMTGTVIDCDKPAMDGCEPQNLLDPLSRTGFVAERFIRPPLIITLTFPFPIDLCAVCVHPSIHSQKSTGFRLFTSFSDSSKLSESSHMDYLVSQTILSASEPVCFINHRYSGHRRFSQDTTHTCNAQTRSLNNRDFRNVNAVRKLYLHITQTQGSTVPCIKTLRVLGQPASNADPSAVNNLCEKIRERHSARQLALSWNSRLTDDSVSENIQVGVTEAAASLTNDSCIPSEARPTRLDAHRRMQRQEQASIAFPPEFLDSLTYEFMAMPLLLPSGHNIDRNTLDRFIAEEVKWGRTPSDPFTGVTFTDSVRPVHNASLKLRMDEYLLKNNIDVTTIPRTSGRRSQFPESIAPGASKRNGKRPSEPMAVPVTTSVGNKKHKSTVASRAPTSSYSLTHPTSAFSWGSKGTSHQPQQSQMTSNLQRQDTHLSVTREVPSSVTVKPAALVTFSENKLQASIQSILGQLPQLGSSSSHGASVSNRPGDGVTKPKCSGCGADEALSLYKGTCGHLVCRSCIPLQQSSSSSSHIVCKACKTVCARANLTKYHE